MTHTWYVTCEIRNRGRPSKKGRRPRGTRTFATEAEAKMFARTKLAEGLIVFGGTINPYFPKRLVLSSDVARWVEEQREPTSNEDQSG